MNISILLCQSLMTSIKMSPIRNNTIKKFDTFVSTKEKHGTVRFMNLIYYTEFTSPPAWRSGYRARLPISGTLYESDGSNPDGPGELHYFFKMETSVYCHQF